MEREELKSVVESLIFVSEEPISLEVMTMALEETGVNKKDVAGVLEEIRNDYEGAVEKGIHIIEVAGGYQFRTKPACAEWIKRLNVPRPVRLSQPAMETLSIVAYRQPILRSEIESIRGVDCGGVLKTLLEKELVRIIGKSDEAGCPLVYGTTQNFLEMFSLSSLKELPTLKELEGLEIQEKVGDLGKGEGVEEGRVAGGVGEVIAEYKDGIEAYEPDPEKAAEDERDIDNLDESVKKLRKMEKDVFPKPVEKIEAVLKEADETTSSQDTGEIDDTFPTES